MEKSIIIIGGGVAGLATGCYTQMNGYRTQIFEMHDKPGGLCTAWDRKGYTIDGCLHWLVGSAPGNGLYKYWQELGMLQGKQVINMDQFYRCETPDGGVFTMYSNIDQLEKHMKEIAPEDASYITSITRTMRHVTKLDMNMDKAPELQSWWDKLKMMAGMAPYLGDMRRWSKKTVGDLADGFKSPLLRRCWAFWPRDFSAVGFIITMAWLHNRVAGYTIGGSLPLMRSVEQRYRDLGGKIIYQARVQKILVENNRAVGIRLDSGQEYRADYVVSAADGHATIFEMLEGKYADDTVRGYYEKLPIFTPITYVALGVKRTFTDLPQIISGLTMLLPAPVKMGSQEHTHLHARINNFDPTLAPVGKSIVTVMIDDSYEYWKQLKRDTVLYKAEKTRVANTVIQLLECRFPGISQQVEMIDVSTPVTFERYTGNWQGCYEGFQVTPKTTMLQMKKTLPGLDGFYMVGQWVSPGGGLPSGVITGRHLTQVLCHRDGKKFQTSTPDQKNPDIAFELPQRKKELSKVS